MVRLRGCNISAVWIESATALASIPDYLMCLGVYILFIGHVGSEGTVSSLLFSGRQLWSASTDGTLRLVSTGLFMKHISLVLFEQIMGFKEQ